jgi:hypothetical protein
MPTGSQNRFRGRFEAKKIPDKDYRGSPNIITMLLRETVGRVGGGGIDTQKTLLDQRRCIETTRRFSKTRNDILAMT